MYKVYVGCLPASCTSEQLAAFFSRFGPIEDTKVTRKAGSKLCSGNGTFGCKDRPTYEQIISVREFDFFGRSVRIWKRNSDNEAKVAKSLRRVRRQIVAAQTKMSESQRRIRKRTHTQTNKQTEQTKSSFSLCNLVCQLVPCQLLSAAKPFLPKCVGGRVLQEFFKFPYFLHKTLAPKP